VVGVPGLCLSTQHHPKQQPITIRNQYSSVFALPERTQKKAKTRVAPLSAQRVNSSDDKELVGPEQIRILLEDENMPFHAQLCAEVADSSYNKPAYLYTNLSKPTWSRL
jgi:hypothetical protein